MNQTLSNQTNIIYLSPDFNVWSYVVYSDYNVARIAANMISMVTSFISILVFANPNLADSTYKSLLMIAISDCVDSMIIIFIAFFTIYCESSPFICGQETYRISFYIDLIFFYFFSFVLEMFSELMELLLTLQRLFMVKNIRFMREMGYKSLGLVCMLTSLLWTVIIFASHAIGTTGSVWLYKNQFYTQYYIKFTDFATSLGGKIFITILDVIRLFGITAALFIVSIWSIFTFRAYLAKKMTMVLRRGVVLPETTTFDGGSIVTRTKRGSDSRPSVHTTGNSESRAANRNITLMLISIGLLYCVGMLPFLISVIGYYIPNIYSIAFQIKIGTISTWCLYIFPSFKLLVYFAFNKHYRAQLISYCKSILSVFKC